MMKTILISQIGVQITDPKSYLSLIFLFALIIRFALTLFKTAAVKQGEADEKDFKFSDKSSEEIFLRLFFSWGHHRNVDDYWLPFLLTSIELYVYPIFIAIDKWSFIGAWLVIKTAIQWRTWQEDRTTHFRMLTGNAFVVVLALFLSEILKEIITA